MKEQAMTSPTLDEFTNLPATDVANLVQQHTSHPLAIGIPFNGTRRWYLATQQKSPQDIYSDDYLEVTYGRMLEVMHMLLEDGVHTIYTPIIGRALAERGEEYMQFVSQAVSNVALPHRITFYQQHNIAATAYGELEHLPETVQQQLEAMRSATITLAQNRFIRFGVFADNETDHLIQQIIDIYQTRQITPTATDLITRYYDAMAVPVSVWIGCDQPTIFDIPMMIRGDTALYFLQYPTPYLDVQGWRRILYDYLFIRGDEETLYPHNISTARQITGLGKREEGCWRPSDE